MAYSTSGSSLVNGFSTSFTLPKGYYYLNMHFNYRSNVGRVTGSTTWTLSGATTVYVTNGGGNYNCNALYQGLIYSDGTSIRLSCTNDGDGAAYAFPYELVAYKV